MKAKSEVRAIKLVNTIGKRLGIDVAERFGVPI